MDYRRRLIIEFTVVCKLKSDSEKVHNNDLVEPAIMVSTELKYWYKLPLLMSKANPIEYFFELWSISRGVMKNFTPKLVSVILAISINVYRPVLSASLNFFNPSEGWNFPEFFSKFFNNRLKARKRQIWKRVFTSEGRKPPAITCIEVKIVD